MSLYRARSGDACACIRDQANSSCAPATFPDCCARMALLTCVQASRTSPLMGRVDREDPLLDPTARKTNASARNMSTTPRAKNLGVQFSTAAMIGHFYTSKSDDFDMREGLRPVGQVPQGCPPRDDTIVSAFVRLTLTE